MAEVAGPYGEWLIRGYLSTTTNIGCMAYRVPNYHEEGDMAGRVDVENVTMVTKATLAAVVRVAEGRAPSASAGGYREERTDEDLYAL